MKRLISISLLFFLTSCGAMSTGNNLIATAPPANHSAVLTWQPSSTAGVTYRVYRSDSAGGPAWILGEVSATTYTDSTVEHKHTYFWQVTALCKTCDPNESAPTAPVSGTIP